MHKLLRTVSARKHVDAFTVNWTDPLDSGIIPAMLKYNIQPGKTSRIVHSCFFIIMTDYVNGGELFTHLVQRVRFKEQEVSLYSGEIVLALEHLHTVSVCRCCLLSGLSFLRYNSLGVLVYMQLQ